MKKLISKLVIPCFLFSIILATGCAKSAPVSSPAAEKKVQEPQGGEKAPVQETYDEETVWEQFRERQAEAAAKAAAAEAAAKAAAVMSFKEVPEPAINKDFSSSPNLSTVHFDFDRASIRAADKKLLNGNADWLNKNSKASVKIIGHCDQRGTSSYNLALGDKRANATKDYLVSLGVDASRITTSSLGEEKPLCTNMDESCWSQNRRAEFHVTQ